MASDSEIDCPVSGGWCGRRCLQSAGSASTTGQLGAAIPVDAGSYTVETTAPGYVAWTRKGDLVSNRETTPVEASSLELDSAAATTSVPAAAQLCGSNRTKDIPPPSRPASHGLGTTRPAGLVAGGLGVAGLGTGATLGVLGAPPSSSTASASPRPALRAGLGRVHLEGAW